MYIILSIVLRTIHIKVLQLLPNRIMSTLCKDLWYRTNNFEERTSEPGSDMAGVNVVCEDCDGLQNLT
jgi:hypothetical protein